MRRTTARWLAGLTVLAAALRFATLDLQSFWLDESVTALLVRRDFGDMLATIPDSESTPPLYYVVAWAWAQVFGPWEVGLRSLSALLGTALVPLVYAAGARAATTRIGLAAAALTAVNPLLVWYSQEARAYSLLLVLCAVALLYFLRVLDGWRDRDLLIWALASALALSTHYFAAVAVVSQAFWLLIAGTRAGRGLQVGASVGLPVLTAVALAPLAIDQRSNEFADYIEESALARRLAQLPKQLLVGFDAPAELFVTVLALALAAVSVWLALTRSGGLERRRLRLLLAFSTAFAGAPVLLALSGVDYFNTRNVIVVWLPLVLLVGIGLGARRAGRLGLVGLATLVTVSIAIVAGVAADQSLQREDWRGLADELGGARAGRVIVATPLNSHLPLELYLTRIAKFPAAASVREIAVVAMGAPEAAGRGNTRLPKPEPVRIYTTETGFPHVRRYDADGYGLIRMSRPDTVTLTNGSFGHLIRPGEAAEILLQPAGSRPR